MLHTFALAFIPLFVAIDAFGVLPIYLSLTTGIGRDGRKHLLWRACLTAFCVALAFLLTGRALFNLLSLTADDFRIAGGLLLLVMAIADLISPHKEARRKPADDIGVVPLGIPLIIGPAALTTLLTTVSAHGYGWTFVSLMLNLAIVWLVFHFAERIVGVVGPGATRAVGKVASLFLAAIGVMLIRVGVHNLLSGIH